MIEAQVSIAALTAENLALREEVARLKGHKDCRPIKLSGMAQSGNGTPPPSGAVALARGG